MENEKYQKELFEFEAPKAPKRRFGQFFQKTDFVMQLTADKAVFIAIGIIMLLVVSFALGVEKGKSIAGNVDMVKNVVSQAAAPQIQVQEPVRAAAIQPIPVKAATGMTNITPGNKASSAPYYTIVAVTFLKEDSASREVTRLKARGLEAFVVKSEPYYLACVGSFANKDSARKVLGRVRQIHSDAYVKMR